MDTLTSLPQPFLWCRGRGGHRSRCRQVLRGDRGAVTAELVLATPLLMLMLLAIVQFALWSHATHIARAAASQGLATARMQDGSAAAGAASAQRMLDQLARGPLNGSSVSVDRTATTASVRVSGTATSVVPFLTLPVHAEATGPVERFVPMALGLTNTGTGRNAIAASTTGNATADGGRGAGHTGNDFVWIPLEGASA